MTPKYVLLNSDYTVAYKNILAPNIPCIGLRSIGPIFPWLCDTSSGDN